jgi:hypothetical protein
MENLTDLTLLLAEEQTSSRFRLLSFQPPHRPVQSSNGAQFQVSLSATMPLSIRPGTVIIIGTAPMVSGPTKESCLKTATPTDQMNVAIRCVK